MLNVFVIVVTVAILIKDRPRDNTLPHGCSSFWLMYIIPYLDANTPHSFKNLDGYTYAYVGRVSTKPSGHYEFLPQWIDSISQLTIDCSACLCHRHHGNGTYFTKLQLDKRNVAQLYLLSCMFAWTWHNSEKIEVDEVIALFKKTDRLCVKCRNGH